MRNAQTAWNGIPAGEEKGHQDGTTQHMHREGREGTGEPREKREDRHRSRPPKTCREHHAHTTRALHPPRQ